MEGKWDILPKVTHEANAKCGIFIDAIPLLLRVLEWGGRADTLLLYYMYVCPDLHIKGNFSSAKKMQFSHISPSIAMLLAPFSRGRNAGQRESERCPLERPEKEGTARNCVCHSELRRGRAGSLPPSHQDQRNVERAR